MVHRTAVGLFALALLSGPVQANSWIPTGAGGSQQSGSTPFVGPVDINGTAFALWSTRCPSAAYVGNLYSAWDGATGSTTHTLVTCSAGGVLTETINPLATTCAVSCRVDILYCLNGAGNCGGAGNKTMATNAQRPVVVLNCQNSKICLQFTGINSTCLESSNTTSSQAQPLTISMVWNTITQGNFVEVFTWSNQVSFGSNSPNTTWMYAGLSANTPGVVDGSVHTAQALYNGASSSSYIDGNLLSGLNAFTQGIGTAATFVLGGKGAACVSSQWASGRWFETGVWGGDKTANNATMTANQQAYWGLMTFATLPVGGGGFVTGFSMTSDGTKIARTDTYGLYTFNAGTGFWDQKVTVASMPNSAFGVDPASNGYGVYEAVIAPSLTSHWYMNFNGNVYTTVNSGALWTLTGFTRDTTANTSDNYRSSGKMMAVDPFDDTRVYVGTPTGLFLSTNGGTAFAAVAAVTAPTDTAHGGVLVAFDPSSTHPGNVTQGIYACSYGNGVYHTTNGGAAWALTAGTPTTCNHMIVDAAGIVWLVDDAGGNTQGALKKFAAGAWSTPLASGNALHSVAVDPATGTNVFVCTSGSQLFISTNTGGSFVGPTAIVATAADIPWLVPASTDGQFSEGDCQFDPAGSNLLYNANGIGIFKTNPPTTNVSVTWASQTRNVENLDMNRVVGSNTGNKPFIAAWDRPGFLIVPGTYPSVYGGITCLGGLSSGWSGDTDPTGATAIVIGTPTPGLNCGTSSSAVVSTSVWTQFASQTPMTTNQTTGGCMAASTATHWLWLPDDNGGNANGPWTTTNAGTSWTLQTVGGTISATAPTGWGENYFNPTQPCAADRVTADTYYMYNDGQRAGADQGVWKSINGGVAWSQVFAGGFGGGFRGNLQMKSVPGKAGHLFFTIGSQGNGNHPAATQLFQSTNAGATWNAIANVGETFCIGFGKTFPAQTYPAIIFVGYVSGSFGVWRSIDNFATTPIKIGDGYPMGSLTPIKDCDGDAANFNVYLVTGTNGAFLGTQH